MLLELFGVMVLFMVLPGTVPVVVPDRSCVPGMLWFICWFAAGVVGVVVSVLCALARPMAPTTAIAAAEEMRNFDAFMVLLPVRMVEMPV